MLALSFAVISSVLLLSLSSLEEDLRQNWPVSDTLDLSEMEYSQSVCVCVWVCVCVCMSACVHACVVHTYICVNRLY